MALDSGIPDQYDGIFSSAGLVFYDERAVQEPEQESIAYQISFGFIITLADSKRTASGALKKYIPERQAAG